MMRDLALCYLVWSGLMAAVSAPIWARAIPVHADRRLRFVVSVVHWIVGGVIVPVGISLGIWRWLQRGRT